MFDKMKEMNKLRQLQSAIKKQKIKVEKEGTKIEMRGDFAVIMVKLNPNLDTSKQEDVLIDLLSEARKKMQTIIQDNFKDQMPSF
jgi:DNA-binding protein YbaB